MQETKFDCRLLAHTSFMPSAHGAAERNEPVHSGTAPYSYQRRQDDGSKRPPLAAEVAWLTTRATTENGFPFSPEQMVLLYFFCRITTTSSPIIGVPPADCVRLPVSFTTTHCPSETLPIAATIA